MKNTPIKIANSFVIFSCISELINQSFLGFEYEIALLPICLLIIYSFFRILLSERITFNSLIAGDNIQILCFLSLSFGLLFNYFTQGSFPLIMTISLFWISITCFRIYSTKFPISGYDFLWVLIFLVIPYAVLNNKFFVQPSEFRVYLISVHFSGTLGGIITIYGINCVNMMKIKNTLTYVKNYAIIATGSLLALASQSRTVVIAVLFSVTLKLLFYNKISKFKLFCVTVFSVISVFFIVPFVQSNALTIAESYRDTPLNIFFRLDNAKTYGVASGRDWLWEYHLKLFNEYPLIGAPREKVLIKVGQSIDSQTSAKASSESFLTSVLASYGIWGVSYYALLLILLWDSLKSDNSGAYLFTTFAIIMCFGISLLGSPYGFCNTSIYLLIFSEIYPSRGNKFQKI